MKSPNILGLTGPAGSGKDTVADLLVVHAGFVKLAFADPLRSEITNAYTLDPQHLTQRETKEHPLSALALSRCLSDGFVARMIIMHTLGGQRLDLDAPRSPRQIMQWWGTEYRRHQHSRYWIAHMQARINAHPGRDIVITDCRFEDEVDLVRHSGGQLWQITRNGVEVAQGGHVSEVSGSEFRPDVVINNSHSIGHLQARVLEALELVGLRVAA